MEEFAEAGDVGEDGVGGVAGVEVDEGDAGVFEQLDLGRGAGALGGEDEGGPLREHALGPDGAEVADIGQGVGGGRKNAGGVARDDLVAGVERIDDLGDRAAEADDPLRGRSGNDQCPRANDQGGEVT